MVIADWVIFQNVGEVFLVTLFWVGFLNVVYFAVANLVRLRISVSGRSQDFVRILSLCWITDGHTIHPPIEGVLPPYGIRLTLFRNTASKEAGLHVHDMASG